jgi:hypothetical protein
MTRTNRGGFGWQEPTPFGGGRRQGKTNAHDEAMAFDAFVREQVLRAGFTTDGATVTNVYGFDAGDASPTPPTNRWPNAIHDDPIDMVEIGGVWMCQADAVASLQRIEAR